MVKPERSLTRDELLEEMLWAIEAIKEANSLGSAARLQRNPLYRYALAFLWLRLGEPANQLVCRRLVSTVMADRWEFLCMMRNQLAHDRDQDIDYPTLWRQVAKSFDSIYADVLNLKT